MCVVITVAEIDPTSGPSVDAALSTSPTQAVLQAEPRKPTIGGRKPTGAKKAKGVRIFFCNLFVLSLIVLIYIFYNKNP